MVSIPFALKDGRTVHVSEVARGIACKCLCPACGGELIAKQGLKVMHHFSHASGVDCPHALESSLHLGVKSVLERTKKLRVPAVKLAYEHGRKSFQIHPSLVVEFDSISIEKRCGAVTPDILGFIGARSLAVEVFVTHKCDTSKVLEFEKQDQAAIELDLSYFVNPPGFEEIEAYLMTDEVHKAWLFNPKAQWGLRRLRELSVNMPHVRRRLATHVDNCPVNARSWKGKSYANIIDDCSCCDFLVEWNDRSLLCGGKCRITTWEQLKLFSRQKG